MASIRITRFAGLLPQIGAKLLPNDHAQIAHNCLLWDGYLRPMPSWVIDQTLSASPQSLYKFISSRDYDYDTNYKYAYQNTSEPFVNVNPIGINNFGLLGTYTTGIFPSTCLLGLPPPKVTLPGVWSLTSRNFLSYYPISRTYAVTYISGGQESVPYVFPQIGTDGTLFEGDGVLLQFNLDLTDVSPYVNLLTLGIRLYRTVPGFDTSEQLANPLETGFHLVGSYTGLSSSMSLADYPDLTAPVDPLTKQPGDLLISDQWEPPPAITSRKSLFFGQTEGGWAVNARVGGISVSTPPHVVEFSERYLHYAWPPQNKLFIPDVITGMAIYYDNVFIGTQTVPYLVRVGVGDGDALDLNVKPFLDNYACISGTMTGTNFGAMYASKDGLIALTIEGDTVSTKKIANPGDALDTGITTFHFYSATQAGWWNGFYFGFTPQGGYIFNQPNPVNNEFPLGELVTIDLPSGIVGPNIAVGSGFYSAWGNIVYKFPFPGYGYESAPKQSYRWKSKRYVMPGLTNFAGMKVINDASGSLQITLNCFNLGGGNTPSFVFTRPLNHSKPFRLPHQGAFLEFEIILEGTSVVQEVHVATSFRELTEAPNG